MAPRLAVVVCVALLATSSVGAAQDLDPGEVARQVHERGGYADDIVLEQSSGGDGSFSGTSGSGAGGGGGRGRPTVDARGGTTPPDGSPELAEWIRDLLRLIAQILARVGGPLGYLILALAIAAALALVAFVIARFSLPLQRAPVARAAAAAGLDEAVDPLLAGAIGDPDELARQGKFREAIRAAFLAALRRASPDIPKSRTAREAVRDVPPSARGRGALDDLLGMAERVWFGGLTATADDYTRARALLDAVGAPPPPGAAA